MLIWLHWRICKFRHRRRLRKLIAFEQTMHYCLPMIKSIEQFLLFFYFLIEVLYVSMLLISWSQLSEYCIFVAIFSGWIISFIFNIEFEKWFEVSFLENQVFPPSIFIFHIYKILWKRLWLCYKTLKGYFNIFYVKGNLICDS